MTDKAPKTRQITKFLTEEIRTGSLKPGDSIYSIRRLANRFSVSTAVINSVYKILEKQGLAISEQGRGTFVPDQVLIRDEASHSHSTKNADSGIALLTSYQVGSVEGYYESQTEIMNESGQLCFTCHMSDMNEEYVSDSQIEQLRKVDPACLLVDADGTWVDIKKFESLRACFDVVFFNRWYWTSPPKGAAILCDFLDGCRQAGEYLEKKGCERLAVIGFQKDFKPFHLKAAMTAAQGMGLGRKSTDLAFFPLDVRQGDEEAIKAFFSVKNIKTGVFGLNDHAVSVFLREVECLMGEKMDVQKIGYHDTQWSRTPGDEFASVRIDYRALWRAVSDFHGKSRTADVVLWVKPTIIER